MKHKTLKGEKGQWIIIMAFGVVLLLVTFCYSLAPQSSSSKTHDTNTPALVQNAPAEQLERPDKVEVLKTLLEQDREEIRFYQDKLFTVSFAFSAALLGMVAFALKTTGPDSLLRRFFAASCFIFCIFYLLFAQFANNAIVQNNQDLAGIQYALDLSQPNAYLAHGQVIYGLRDPKSAENKHIYWLAIFNIMLAVASAVVLKYAPKVEGDTG